MKKFITLSVALLLSGVFVLSGCIFRKKPKDNVIRVNEVTRSVHYAPFYVALSKGYFEEEDIKIELFTGEGADNSMTSLLTGAADVGLMGVEAAVYVNIEGKQNAPKVFAELTKRDGSFLIGRNHVEDFDWRTHLEGKEVLVGRPGGMPAMTFEYAVNQLGLHNGQNITLNFDIPYPNLAPAFLGGQGDFVNLFEPLASDIAANSDNVYNYGSIGLQAGEVPFTAFMATENYLQKNSTKIEGFIRALIKGYNYLVDANLEEAAEALKPYFVSTTEEDLKNTIISYRNVDGWSDNPVMTQDAYNRLLAVMKNAGRLDQDIEMNKIVDNSFANKVVAEFTE